MVSTVSEFNPFSVPSLSLTSQLTIENNDDDELDKYDRQRSNSFLEHMKQNIPSPARIPSPKVNRKVHSHHSNREGHHHRRYSSHNSHSGSHKGNNRSPLLSPATFPDFGEAVTRNRYLDIQSEFTGRMRSNSDGDARKLLPSSPGTIRRSRSNTGIATVSYTRDSGSSDGFSSTSSLDKSGHSPTLCKKGKDKKEQDVPYDVTLTRRAVEIHNAVSPNKTELCKRKTLVMIDRLFEQCDSNYQEVESQINFTFCRLSLALDARRKELLEDARKKRDLKKETLAESRQKCKRCSVCEECIATCNGKPNSITSNGYHTPDSDSRRSSGSPVDEQDERLQHNGILEPWKTAPVEEAQNIAPNTDSKSPDDDDVFADTLEEGNLIFLYNEEQTEIFNTIGILKEDLSSPRFTYVKMPCKGLAITDETVYFEVHTKNKDRETTFNKRDKLEITIQDCHGENVDVVIPMLQTNKKGNILTNMTSLTSSQTAMGLRGNRFYSPYFTPTKAGDYRIKIFLNSVEIESSPLKYTVYPKLNLAFDITSPEERKDQNTSPLPPSFVKVQTEIVGDLCRRSKGIITRQSSEDSDWFDSNWILQKGDKSTLLRSNDDIPSYIYAATTVTGLCAWKIRVTSACASITLSIGVGTRTGVPDIDEHFSCEYVVGNDCVKTEGRKMSEKRGPMRKSSSFTRVSLTYCVLLNTEEQTVRVIPEHSDEEKTISISSNIAKKMSLYPFISMIHHHDSCFMQVCPKPQITLL